MRVGGWEREATDEEKPILRAGGWVGKGGHQERKSKYACGVVVGDAVRTLARQSRIQEEATTAARNC